MKEFNAVYEAPCLEVVELQMEQCVLSGSYGEPGMPGQGSGIIPGDDI